MELQSVHFFCQLLSHSISSKAPSEFLPQVHLLLWSPTCAPWCPRVVYSLVKGIGGSFQFGVCCGLNAPHPKFTCWNLIPNTIVLEDGAFERCLGHDGEVLVSGISVLIKGTPQGSLASSSTREHSGKTLAMDQEVELLLLEGPPPFRVWEMPLVCKSPVHGVLL